MAVRVSMKRAPSSTNKDSYIAFAKRCAPKAIHAHLKSRESKLRRAQGSLFAIPLDKTSRVANFLIPAKSDLGTLGQTLDEGTWAIKVIALVDVVLVQQLVRASFEESVNVRDIGELTAAIVLLVVFVKTCHSDAQTFPAAVTLHTFLNALLEKRWCQMLPSVHPQDKIYKNDLKAAIT